MKKALKILIVSLCLVTLLGGVFADAYQSYQSYTYSIDGWYMDSPDAYVPTEIIDSKTIGLKKPLDDPKDITVDSDKNIYIADAKNNRIVVLNKRGELRFEIDDFVNDQGVNDSLANPSGVFVNDDFIYVADTDKNRIVVFNKDGTISKIVGAPESYEIGVDDLYQPIAIAVDASGRMYVVSSTTYRGIIALDKDGNFQGYIGAQKVTISSWDIFWRKFQTAEQRANSLSYVSTEYNNIAIDESGFIYVTTSSIDEASQQAAMTGKSASGDYAPVKKLNSAGNEILKRNGFYPPSGEVKVSEKTTSDSSIIGASKIIDVALGPEGTWTIIDEKRSKLFTYDEEGRLLFVFGDQGVQLGNMQSIQSITYMGDDLLVLDKTADNITVFKRTEYGDILIQALKNTRERNYDLAESDWQEILKRNNNFDAAYVGIGRAYYRQNRYEEAMDYYRFAYDTTNYSDAFKYYRKDWVSQYAIVVPIVIIVLCFAIAKFFGFAAKMNKAVATKPGKRTYIEEFMFVFHLMFHPFDGFWDLKHEKRGSLRGAFTIIIIAILAFTYNAVGTSYLFNPYGTYINIFGQIISIFIPVILWCVANWCLTTLFEGEGSFKDIFIATSYSLMPIPLIIIPATLLTNVFTITEGQIITLITTIMWIWVGGLVFFGSMVTHDYSFSKNILTSAGTIVGMVFIIFMALLFSSLLQKIVTFITGIVVEVSYRM